MKALRVLFVKKEATQPRWLQAIRRRWSSRHVQKIKYLLLVFTPCFSGVSMSIVWFAVKPLSALVRLNLVDSAQTTFVENACTKILFKAEWKIGIDEVNPIADSQAKAGEIIPLQATDRGTTPRTCR